MNKTLLLPLVFILLIFFGTCSNHSQPIKNENDQYPKVTIEKLLKSQGVRITENGIELVKYPVIIYTNDLKELEKTNVLIQSKSQNFVTALISPQELELIYRIDGVYAIEIPPLENIH
ncbi:MAG TPA: hypothetical protein VIG94_03315 [Faecalibacter sp.]